MITTIPIFDEGLCLSILNSSISSNNNYNMYESTRKARLVKSIFSVYSNYYKQTILYLSLNFSFFPKEKLSFIQLLNKICLNSSYYSHSLVNNFINHGDISFLSSFLRINSNFFSFLSPQYSLFHHSYRSYKKNLSICFDKYFNCYSSNADTQVDISHIEFSYSSFMLDSQDNFINLTENINSINNDNHLLNSLSILNNLRNSKFYFLYLLESIKTSVYLKLEELEKNKCSNDHHYQNRVFYNPEGYQTKQIISLKNKYMFFAKPKKHERTFNQIINMYYFGLCLMIIITFKNSTHFFITKQAFKLLAVYAVLSNITIGLYFYKVLNESFDDEFKGMLLFDIENEIERVSKNSFVLH